MKTILSILVVLFALIACIVRYLWIIGSNPAPSDSSVVSLESLICADGTEIGVSVLANDHVIVTLGGTPYELTPVVSASGARYANADESFVFWNSGIESSVLVNGEVVYEECRVPGTEPAPINDEGAVTEDVSDRNRLTEPVPGDTIESPLVLTGEARGTWYFEATFPIVLTNWDGLIIAEGYAEAEGDWMTEEFVPFTATLTFTNPVQEGDPDFMHTGYLILQKDNPSGLPENDAALEIPVRFATSTASAE